MKSLSLTDTNTLIDNLALRDVPYFAGPFSSDTPLISDEALLMGLVCHEAARIQMALIPLLLRHPELSDTVPNVVTTLPESEQTILKLYYMAAVLLQRATKAELERLLGDTPQLQDLYSGELGVAGETTEERLISLAGCHARFSGLDLNWIGTYWHSANRFLKSLRRRRQGQDSFV